jgi:hypothetical protein
VQIGDVTVLVADGEVDVDEVDGDLEGLDVLVLLGLGGGVAGGWRAAGGWGFLCVESGGEGEAKDGSSDERGAHLAIRRLRLQEGQRK